MKEHVLNILIYLFESFVENSQPPFEFESTKITSKLKRAGFLVPDITKAIQWLNELKDSNFYLSSTQHNSTFRIYSPDEQAKLSTAARYTLYCLEKDQVITPSSREIIINRAMAIDLDEVHVDELKWILLFVLCIQGDMEIKTRYMDNVALIENTSDAIH